MLTFTRNCTLETWALALRLHYQPSTPATRAALAKTDAATRARADEALAAIESARVLGDTAETRYCEICVSHQPAVGNVCLGCDEPHPPEADEWPMCDDDGPLSLDEQHRAAHAQRRAP